MVESALVLVGSGIVIGVLGALIKYAGVMHLIAGYDPEKVDDEEGLADFIGTNTLYVSILTVGVGVLELRGAATATGWYWIVFVIAVFAIAFRMIRGARRYESASEQTRTERRESP